MLHAGALDAYYKTLTGQELLKLSAEGGLTAEAEQRLGKELVRRGLTPEEAKRKYAPEWFDKADVGSRANPTTAKDRLSDKADRLSVTVVSPDKPLGTAAGIVELFRSVGLFHSSRNPV